MSWLLTSAQETSKIPFPYAAKGHVLIWGGMLISLNDDHNKWTFVSEVLDMSASQPDQDHLKCECLDALDISGWRLSSSS